MGFLNCATHEVDSRWIQGWCEQRFSQITKHRFVCESRTSGKLKITNSREVSYRWPNIAEFANIAAKSYGISGFLAKNATKYEVLIINYFYCV